ncbi:MAG: 3D domain-containing protein [Hyphomonadaceae bacterium]|nr:3D domain-containing protein [Hyphomonadaceae bacterium]
MKRVLLALLLVVAAGLMVAGPQLRKAFAATHVEVTVAPGELHPSAQALNFLLAPPGDTDKKGKAMKLWATYYHMPTLRPSLSNITARPLLGRNGKAISPPLSVQDWCDAAMQGSVWVDNGVEEPTAYMYVDSRGPEQNTCDKYFGELSVRIKSATRRSRFIAFHHPQACDVRPIPLMAFRTIAVDPDKIKMGTVLYVPALRGLGFWDNGELYAHDGYVVASDRGGAIEGNHIDMFVDNAAGSPFPDVVRSNPRHTFEAFVMDKNSPAARALKSAHEVVCKDVKPGAKYKPKPSSI